MVSARGTKVLDSLKTLGLALPAESPKALASYVPFVKVPTGASSALVFISGQIPWKDDWKSLHTGKLASEDALKAAGAEAGKEGGLLGVAAGQEAARRCALSVINQLNGATDGDLGKVKRIVKIEGFVNSTEDFTAQPLVINGELMKYELMKLEYIWCFFGYTLAT